MTIRGIFLLILALHFALPSRAAETMTDRSGTKPTPSPDAREQKKRPQPRRHVPAIIPQAVPPSTNATPLPTPRAPAMPPSQVQRPSQPDHPATVTACDPAGCWDGGGNRYNSGNGTTYLNNAGKLCTRNGAWMQCF